MSLQGIRKKLLRAARESDTPLDTLTPDELATLAAHTAEEANAARTRTEAARVLLSERIAEVVREYEGLTQVYGTRITLEVSTRGTVRTKLNRISKKAPPLPKPMLAFALWARKVRGLSPDEILDTIEEQFGRSWPGLTREGQKASLKVALSRASMEMKTITRAKSATAVARWAGKRKGFGRLARAAKAVA